MLVFSVLLSVSVYCTSELTGLARWELHLLLAFDVQQRCHVSGLLLMALVMEVFTKEQSVRNFGERQYISFLWNSEANGLTHFHQDYYWHVAGLKG